MIVGQRLAGSSRVGGRLPGILHVGKLGTSLCGLVLDILGNRACAGRRSAYPACNDDIASLAGERVGPTIGKL